MGTCVRPGGSASQAFKPLSTICKFPSNQFSHFVQVISRLFQFAYTDAFVLKESLSFKMFQMFNFFDFQRPCLDFFILISPTGYYKQAWVGGSILNPHAMAGSPLGATNLPSCHIRLLRQSHPVIPTPRLFPQNLLLHQSVPG